MITKDQSDLAILQIAKIINDLNTTPEQGLAILEKALLAHPHVMGVEVTTSSDIEAMAKESEFKHTPGPWFIEYNRVQTKLDLRVLDQDYSRICEFPDPMYATKENKIKSEQESKANARLISAAPEMLDALEHALADLKALGGRTLKIEAAIAKARGDSK